MTYLTNFVQNKPPLIWNIEWSQDWQFSLNFFVNFWYNSIGSESLLHIWEIQNRFTITNPKWIGKSWDSAKVEKDFEMFFFLFSAHSHDFNKIKTVHPSICPQNSFYRQFFLPWKCDESGGLGISEKNWKFICNKNLFFKEVIGKVRLDLVNLTKCFSIFCTFLLVCVIN